MVNGKVENMKREQVEMWKDGDIEKWKSGQMEEAENWKVRKNVKVENGTVENRTAEK